MCSQEKLLSLGAVFKSRTNETLTAVVSFHFSLFTRKQIELVRLETATPSDGSTTLENNHTVMIDIFFVSYFFLTFVAGHLQKVC